MKIVLAMPGSKRRMNLQESFWQRGIVDTGLEPHTTLCFQANGAWAKSYPEDLLAYMDADAIAAEQYRFTSVRLDDGFQPKPYTHAFLDYEPKKRHDDPPSSWQGNKYRDGYNAHDLEALAAMRRGIQKATDGLPLGSYRNPVLPKYTLTDADGFRAESIRPFAESLDWQWLHCYPQYILGPGNIARYGAQVATHFNALSEYGKRVIPWLWPSYQITASHAENYGRWVVQTIAQLPGVDTVGVWVDCNQPNATEKQIENMTEIAPYLRAWDAPYTDIKTNGLVPVTNANSK